MSGAWKPGGKGTLRSGETGGGPGEIGGGGPGETGGGGTAAGKRVGGGLGGGILLGGAGSNWKEKA